MKSDANTENLTVANTVEVDDLISQLTRAKHSTVDGHKSARNRLFNISFTKYHLLKYPIPRPI
jgi:hypothetical protein